MKKKYAAAFAAMMTIAQAQDAETLFKDARWIEQPIALNAAAPRFSTTFKVEKDGPATIAICGFGQYVATLNGTPIGRGDEFNLPGWTRSTKTCFYNVFTPSLKAGEENTLEITLGNGMYNVPDPGKGLYTKFKGSEGEKKLIVGGVVKSSVDGWKVEQSEVVRTHVYSGDDIDHRVGMDAAHAGRVTVPVVAEAPKGVLREAPFVCRLQETKVPVRTMRVSDDELTVDFGQNAAYVPTVVAKGPCGSRVEIEFSEIPLKEGETKITKKPGGYHGTVARCAFTLAGDGDETFTPPFFYYGFRYMKVRLFPAAGGALGERALPKLVSASARVVMADAPRAGTFECSIKLFNQIHDICWWAQRSNMQSVFTDCPHREKLGWQEQDHIHADQIRWGWNADAMFAKTCRDLADSQLADGMVPDIAPEYTVFRGGFRHSIEWGASMIQIPWQQYEWTGDDSLIREYWENMVAYHKYIRAQSQNEKRGRFITPGGLGDWYQQTVSAEKRPLRRTSIDFTATAFYYLNAVTLANCADLLGKKGEAAEYREEAANIKKAFNAKWWNPKGHCYENNSQTANSMAIAFGLADPAETAAIVSNIVEDVRGRGAVGTGEIGYPYLLKVLAENGQSDVIFDMTADDTKPGYGYMVAKGNTTCHEAWDCREGSSFNHFMMADIVNWFYCSLGGIKRTAPGFKTFTVSPEFLPGLDWVKAHHTIATGDIRVEWRRENGTIRITVNVPEGTTATVRLPGRADVIQPSGERAYVVRDGTAKAEAASASAEQFKPGTKISGFVVKSVVDLPEVKGRLVRMEYEKNGAELAWLDRDDDNKTFAIGFRTLPDDDTGVAHIIEHSVLCGSDKYPVKEPFVSLLKSSFSTFLNAFTTADATMYPVCSRNQKDFLNLMDVYMDAVLHPLSVKSPLAFRQEGWHYELSDSVGELKRNGVVFSEMKGVFADPERRLHHELDRLLFPDTCYGYVSGGDPAAIPSLTFEKYKAFYERFYHPSNARIFLDGRMDVQAALAKLDEYLAPYDRKAIDAPVKYQWPIATARTLDYELGEGESPEGKFIVAEGWVCGKFDEREKILALDIISDALAGDNEAPLKKALVSAGLCEDVRMSIYACAQIRVQLTAKGVKEADVEVVRRTIRDTIACLADEGLDHSRISALLDRAEFHDREKDYDRYPRGLAFYMDAVDLWHYGGDPADAFRHASLFASLRKRLSSDYYETLLHKALVANQHHARITMRPSATLAADNLAAAKKELAGIKAGWTPEELQRTLEECRALEKHQNTPDRPEDVAKLPMLSVADVPEKGPFTAREIAKVGDVTVIRPHTQANGVLHAICYFDVSDMDAKELADLPMLACALGNLPTAKRPIGELRNAIDAQLGNFSQAACAFSDVKTGLAKPYFAVTLSALESHGDDAIALVPEVLRETKFTDVKTLRSLLLQHCRAMERSTTGLSGRNFAFRRAAAQMSSRGAINEIFNGLAHIRRLQELEKEFAADGGAAYAERLSALAAKLFTKDRLVVCLSDNIPLDWAARMAAAFPAGAVGAPVTIAPFARSREGFRTSGAVCSAACVAHPPVSPHCGSAVVAARILTLGYLWDEVRVKGGAYGGNFRLMPNGDVEWLSWNDPNPGRTLGVYAECGKALAKFANGNESLDSYIVSAVAATEPYLTPRMETANAAELWLSGRSPDDQQRVRAEMLRTTKADLMEMSKKIDALFSDATTCVIGGAQPLETCDKTLDTIEPVQP